jgi:epoxyqueuosine reductase
MAYMAAHGLKRARPAELVPGTVSVITARMDYLPRDAPDDWRQAEWQRCTSPGARWSRSMPAAATTTRCCASACSAGRPPGAEVGPLGHRVFTDSAPVLEVELATRSGLGWRGKHTLALHREAGSMFFLGEIFVDLALPPTEPGQRACGSAAPASTPARRRPSWRPTGWTRGAASAT